MTEPGSIYRFESPVGPRYVEHLAAEALADERRLATRINSVMYHEYARALGACGLKNPTELAATIADPRSDASVAKRHTRTLEGIEGGATFKLIWDTDPTEASLLRQRPDALVALTKATPSKPTGIVRRFLGQPNCFIGEVATIAGPKSSDFGLAVWSSIHEYDGNLTVVTQTLGGDELTLGTWQSLHMQKTRDSNPLVIDTQTVPTVQLEANIAGVSAVIVSQHPFIKYAQQIA